GDAMVDILAMTTPDFLAGEKMANGQMQVIKTEAEARRLEDAMVMKQVVAGGSSANSMAGLAMLGRKAAFIGQVADDDHGGTFVADLARTGVTTPKSTRQTPPGTGRCLIFVTPDGERTMNTWRGASETLVLSSADETEIAAADTLLLEAYLWDQSGPRVAMRRAADIAKTAGRRIAFTLAAKRMVENNRADLLSLMRDGMIDLLFANEEEALALMQTSNIDGAVSALRRLVPTSVVTLGQSGALCATAESVVTAPAMANVPVVDTTGAGDLFAAGYLAAESKGEDADTCLRFGAAAAADVIAQVGARPAKGFASRLEAL
ncbi:MAG: adenosine kinase, partial [Pacificimonas sp.]